MPKQKLKKAAQKRIKITATGKLLRRHQLGAGTHRRKKSKSALERHHKLSEIFKGNSQNIKKLLGV